MFIIAIEGNIGTGKSTLGKLIQDRIQFIDGVEFIQEPVHKWVELKDKDGNILEKFIKTKLVLYISTQCFYNQSTGHNEA